MKKCALINAGEAAWLFDDHARTMADAFGVPVVDDPAGVDFAYLLAWDKPEAPAGVQTFIPFEGMTIAADKRLIASAFAWADVPRPETYLIGHQRDVLEFVESHADRRWVLKWPIGCGATGHRIIGPGDAFDDDWPAPFVLQEFVEMESPEVYRLYCVDGETFGWNRRRFPAGRKPSPWVAHAQGAVYDTAGSLPEEAEQVALAALRACNLIDSFGCVDLLPSPKGWLALEVGTDGLYTYVDRDIAVPGIAGEITTRIATAFKRCSNT